MSIHIKPPPRVDQTDQAAEPDRQAFRFDERGIALQTVIIMVVLLAIAGAIAAVLLTRGGEAASQLEAQSISAVKAKNITSRALCNNSNGLVWDTSGSGLCKYKAEAGCNSNGGVKGDTTVTAQSGNSAKQDATKCYSGNTTGAEELGDIKT